MDLKERKEQANLYVGETARSISDRAGEHWEGALGGKEENHMLEHLAASHSDQRVPSFRFRVVKKCKTALERQVREAVRIEMRGNVLNKKGMFNRCKLTRMVIDTEWDKKVWEEAWVETPEEEQDLECLKKSSKGRPASEGSRPAKKLKKDDGGCVWGEQASKEDKSREEFLRGTEMPSAKPRQSEIKVITGVEWLSREIVRECSHRAVEYAELLKGADAWEEWQEAASTEQECTRPSKEERYLWAILNELDKEEYKSEQRVQAKKQRVVASARKKMGAGKNQPSMKQMFLAPNKPASQPIQATIVTGSDTASVCVPRSCWKSSKGGDSSGGSVTVTSPKSQDTLASRDVESSSHGDSLNNSQEKSPLTKLQPHRLPEALVRIGLVPPRESHPPVTTVGIWGPEGNAGIGLVTEEVGPKKLKTGIVNNPVTWLASL